MLVQEDADSGKMQTVIQKVVVPTAPVSSLTIAVPGTLRWISLLSQVAAESVERATKSAENFGVPAQVLDPY